MILGDLEYLAVANRIHPAVAYMDDMSDSAANEYKLAGCTHTGEIRLVKDLRINRKNYTIAGQTAPGMGIVITHNKVNCGGSENFIIRNVRFRVGNETASGDFCKENAFGAENCSHFIIDHCDFGWSAEENIKVVATGGLAGTIYSKTDEIEFLEPDLTMHGLRIIYEKNK